MSPPYTKRQIVFGLGDAVIGAPSTALHRPDAETSHPRNPARISVLARIFGRDFGLTPGGRFRNLRPGRGRGSFPATAIHAPQGRRG